MNLKTNFWVLRQNYGEKMNQTQMKDLILRKKIVTCPWGGWGIHKQNVINGVYNDNSSKQDRRFVEQMNIGDIILIPFAKKKECILARIISNTVNSFDTGLFYTVFEDKVTIGDTGENPFQPVIRHIEIIKDEFIPSSRITNLQTLSKMSQSLVDSLDEI
jgi:hypothetical protein